MKDVCFTRKVNCLTQSPKMDTIAGKGKTDISSLSCNVSFNTRGHVSYCLHTFLFIFNGN